MWYIDDCILLSSLAQIKTAQAYAHVFFFFSLGQIITTQAYADELKAVQVCFFVLFVCAVFAGVDCLYRTHA
jgi:hypothetical protein